MTGLAFGTMIRQLSVMGVIFLLTNDGHRRGQPFLEILRIVEALPNEAVVKILPYRATRLHIQLKQAFPPGRFRARSNRTPKEPLGSVAITPRMRVPVLWLPGQEPHNLDTNASQVRGLQGCEHPCVPAMSK